MSSVALLVDPDTETRLCYRAAFEPHTWTIEEAADGRVALAKALTQRPEVVVTELLLTGMDGVDLCEQIRRAPDLSATRIVVVTGDGSPGAIERAQSAGADRVLIKPCSPHLLAGEIASIRAASWAARHHLMRSVGELYEDIQRTRRIIDASKPLLRSAKRDQMDRYVTATPPRMPPALECPRCAYALRYERSYVGGANEQQSEQWDVFVCRHCAAWFQYRHRTRRLAPFTK
jgi:CheY-like chemotaxis protein